MVKTRRERAIESQSPVYTCIAHDLHNWLKSHAAQQGTSLNEIIVRALARYKNNGITQFQINVPSWKASQRVHVLLGETDYVWFLQHIKVTNKSRTAILCYALQSYREYIEARERSEDMKGMVSMQQDLLLGSNRESSDAHPKDVRADAQISKSISIELLAPEGLAWIQSGDGLRLGIPPEKILKDMLQNGSKLGNGIVRVSLSFSTNIRLL